MGDVDGGGEIERARQLRRDTNHVRRRRQLLIPNDDVEGVGSNEIHREIRGNIADPGRERRGNAGVAQIGGDQSLQLDDELVGTLGRKIDAKQLDRDETILFRLIGAKDRAKSSCADLVKHAKRSESVGRRIAGSVRVQRVLLEGRRSDRNTETHLVQSFRRATVPVLVGSNQVESPVQSDSAGEPTTRIAVDVRRFPWTRRLAADYAYNFSSLAPFFSGDPTDRAAWAHAIRCAQANARHRSEMAQVLASQQDRARRSGSSARGGTTIGRSPRRCARHRTASRAFRRSAVHAA